MAARALHADAQVLARGLHCDDSAPAAPALHCCSQQLGSMAVVCLLRFRALVKFCSAREDLNIFLFRNEFRSHLRNGSFHLLRLVLSEFLFQLLNLASISLVQNPGIEFHVTIHSST